MTDYFAALDEPRRPWIEPESLKSKFLARSNELHPDRTHALDAAEREAANRRYAGLNAAFNALKDPRTRVRHLLELELGRKPEDVHEIPTDLADLFIEVARLNREAGDFLAERAKASSPMLRVQLFERGEEWTGRLQAMQQRLEERQGTLREELKRLDTDWSHADADPSARGPLLQRLGEIQRLLSFHARWSAQIQEAIVQLSL